MSQQKTSTNNNAPSKDPKKSSELFLPPNINKKKTLVLDLDETLVHSQFGPFNIPSDVVINIEIENELHDIHVLIRPGVKEFLEKMSKKFEIVIFTASISKYAGPLLDILDKEKFCSFRLFREHCTFLNSSFVKDLKKLGRDLKDVIIVDNSPMAYLLNSDNGLPIMTWFDDKNDKELFKITPILDFLSQVPDVRNYIHKIVINNEISYDNAMKVINEYNENNNRNTNNKEKRESNNFSIEENIEISDGSDNNLAVIKKDKNQQQININIINNNITNYIYDNKQNQKDENINNNIMNNEVENKIKKNNFNPNSIIASVSSPNNPQIFTPLTPFIKEKKNRNSNSTKNINSKNGQYNNNYAHKKSASSGFGYNYKPKKNNLEEMFYLNNNKIKNNINKNYSLRNNTNYNSKSHNKKEIKAKINTNTNKNTKSAKNINNIKKQIYSNNKNILVSKKAYVKNHNEQNQIKLYNDGNLTTVHNKQKIVLNLYNAEKTHRNYNKKNKTNTNNNLIHSVDIAKNEIAVYYHNDNYPFLKQENYINNGGFTNKNKNLNKFLKNNKINNNKKSSSIDKDIEKNDIEKNKFKNIKLNNDFNYSKNKNNGKKFLFNPSLQEEQKKFNLKKEKVQTYGNNDLLLKEKNKNNSAIDIISNSDNNLAKSQQIKPHSESMKNLIPNEKEEKKNKNLKNSTANRPKSSTVFKKNKVVNKNKQIKRNASGRNAKNINLMKFDIIEILERRGIAKTNRAKFFKSEYNYNNFIINNINQNVKNKNIHNNFNEKSKTSDNIIKIKTKDI